MNNWHLNTQKELCERYQQGRLPHALLLTGAAGIGKYTFALALAQALFCEDRSDSQEACGHCSACQLYAAGTYPDFFDIGLEVNDDGKQAKEIKIDQIRHLCAKLSLTSARSALKIAIINTAERMNSSAANSLLKTLEEPSAETLIILVSSHPARLPVTVRSRCQSLILKSPPREAVLAALKAEYPAQDADVLLALGGGAPRFAQEAAEGEGELITARKQFFQDLLQLSERKANPVELAKSWHKPYPDNTLGWWISAVQDIARLAASKAQQMPINQDFAEALKALSARIDLTSMLDYQDQLLKAKQQLTRSVNIELLYETLMLNWADLTAPTTPRG